MLSADNINILEYLEVFQKLKEIDGASEEESAEFDKLKKLGAHIRHKRGGFGKLNIHEIVICTLLWDFTYELDESPDYLAPNFLVLQRDNINKEIKKFKENAQKYQNSEYRKDAIEFAKNLKLKIKIYYKSLYSHFFQCPEVKLLDKYCKNNAVGTDEERFDVIMDCMLHLLEFGQGDKTMQRLYTLLDTLQDNSDFWTQERKKRTFLEIHPALSKFKSSKLSDYFDQGLKDGLINEIHTIFSDKTKIHEITIKKFKFYIGFIDKSRVVSLKYDDQSNLLHILIQNAMYQNDCGTVFQKYKQLIQLLLDNLSFEEKQELLNGKNNLGLTPHQQFFKLAHIGDNAHQFNDNAAALMEVMLQYTVDLPIKCTNIWWSNFCNAIIQIIIGVSFVELKKSSAFQHYENAKTALFTLHASAFGYFTWKNVQQNVDAWSDFIKRNTVAGYVTKHDWNVKHLVFIGVFGRVQSYFSPFKVFGADLNGALQSNSSGIANLGNAIFDITQLSAQLEKMSMNERRIAYKSLQYRLEHLKFIDENPSIFQYVNNYLWSTQRTAIITEMQNCITKLQATIGEEGEIEKRKDFESYLDSKYSLTEVIAPKNLASRALDTTAKTISTVANCTGIHTKPADIKESIITGISWSFAIMIEALKGLGGHMMHANAT